jgi:hypothetical protein
VAIDSAASATGLRRRAHDLAISILAPALPAGLACSGAGLAVCSIVTAACGLSGFAGRARSGSVRGGCVGGGTIWLDEASWVTSMADLQSIAGCQTRRTTRSSLRKTAYSFPACAATGAGAAPAGHQPV